MTQQGLEVEKRSKGKSSQPRGSHLEPNFLSEILPGWKISPPNSGPPTIRYPVTWPHLEPAAHGDRLGLTYHHEACLVVERGPVGVDQSLLQLLDGDVATVIGVHGLEPGVSLRIHTGRNTTYRKGGKPEESETGLEANLKTCRGRPASVPPWGQVFLTHKASQSTYPVSHQANSLTLMKAQSRVSKHRLNEYL